MLVRKSHNHVKAMITQIVASTRHHEIANRSAHTQSQLKTWRAHVLGGGVCGGVCRRSTIKNFRITKRPNVVSDIIVYIGYID